MPRRGHELFEQISLIPVQWFPHTHPINILITLHNLVPFLHNIWVSKRDSATCKRDSATVHCAASSSCSSSLDSPRWNAAVSAWKRCCRASCCFSRASMLEEAACCSVAFSVACPRVVAAARELPSASCNCALASSCMCCKPYCTCCKPCFML